MRDYAGSYQVKGRSAGRRQGWRAMGQTKGNSVLFWRSIAIIVLLVAAIGVVASYWVGHCIQQSLVGIAKAQELQGRKQQIQTALLDEQVRLLQEKRLEAFAAVQVGLYSPDKRQQIGFQ